jgi:ubiquinone/menaquinone biosynthesis C-methylase UbiE
MVNTRETRLNKSASEAYLLLKEAERNCYFNLDMAESCSYNFWNWFNSATGHPEDYPDEEVVRFVKRQKQHHLCKTTALDLGFGSGKHLKLLAECGYSVVGADWSEGGFLYASKKLRSLGLEGKLDLLNFSIQQLPYPDDSFDIVIATHIFDHISSSVAKRLVDEMCRVIRKDGLALISIMTTKTNKNTRVGIPIVGEENAVVVSCGNSAGEIHRFLTNNEITHMLERLTLLESRTLTVQNDQSSEIEETRYFIARKKCEYDQSIKL